MNSALIIKLLPGWLIYIVMYAATIKILERRLTFVQSLLMSAIAAVVSIALLVIFNLGEASFGAPQYADKLVGFAELLVPGAVVTRLARNHGVGKSGWFGVGAKATFWLLLFIVVLVGGGFAVRYLLAR
jgi:hypothetical protein